MMKKNSHFRKWFFFLSAASYLAKMGHHVEVFEKNDSLAEGPSTKERRIHI